MPTLRIQKNKFLYTREQNSYFGKKEKTTRFISRGSIRQSSIDSILFIIRDLKDSTVYQTNLCIMSGVRTSIIIANGIDTTQFRLKNTSIHEAVKILDILNPYLPKEHQLYNSTKQIEEEKDCWVYLRKMVEEKMADSLRLK